MASDNFLITDICGEYSDEITTCLLAFSDAIRSDGVKFTITKNGDCGFYEGTRLLSLKDFYFSVISSHFEVLPEDELLLNFSSNCSLGKASLFIFQNEELEITLIQNKLKQSIFMPLKSSDIVRFHVKSFPIEKFKDGAIDVVIKLSKVSAVRETIFPLLNFKNWLHDYFKVNYDFKTNIRPKSLLLILGSIKFGIDKSQLLYSEDQEYNDQNEKKIKSIINTVYSLRSLISNLEKKACLRKQDFEYGFGWGSVW